MRLWLSLAAVLTLQETFSTVGVLSLARENHLPEMLIHLLWLSILLIGITFAYSIGKWIEKKLIASKLKTRFTKYRTKFDSALGTYGERLTIFGVAIFISPVVAAAFAAMIDMPFPLTLLLVGTADLLWYIYVWTAAIGVTSFASNIGDALLLIVAAGIALSLLLLWIRRRSR